MGRTEIPKPFLDAFKTEEDGKRLIISVIGDPTKNYGCPDKIEVDYLNGIKYMTYIFGDA